MKILGWGLMLVLLAGALAAALQTGAYFQIRRTAAFDQQEMFHGSGVFHVATVVALSPDQELIPAVRELVQASEQHGARVIYAGKVINGLASAQLPEVAWDAFVLAQFPSRDAYEDASAQRDLRAVRDRFASSYVLGMKRPTLPNLLVPTGLLALRLADIATGEPRRIPFTKADPSGRPAEAQAFLQQLVDGLLAEREYGERALVVLNFSKEGTGPQRDANAGYGLQMLRLMAEARCGPMHIGEPVPLEGDAEYDSIAIVYYPGVQFFADMLQSEFYGGIVDGKQLGDTLSAPTVPLLPHL